MIKNPVSKLVIGLIRMYQKHISPRKGYGCAYRLYGGARTGCSGHGLQLFQRFGVVKAWKLLRRRFDKCAWHSYQENRARYAFAKSQRGECDCGAVDCPTPHCDTPDCPKCSTPECNMPSIRHCGLWDYLNFCDILNGCDCGNNSSKSSKSAGSSLKEPVANKAAEREEKRREKRRLKTEQKDQRKTKDGVDIFR